MLFNDFILISAIFMMLTGPLAFILIEKLFLEGLPVDPKIHQQIVLFCL